MRRRDRQQQPVLVRAERIEQPGVVALARGDEPVEPGQLGDADGRLHVRGLQVVAEVAVDVLVVVAVRQAAELLAEALAAGVVLAAGAVAVAAPVADRARDPGQRLVIGHDHAALAGRDVVRRIEGRGRQVAERAREPVAVARAEGVAVVLDQPQVVLLDQLHDRVEVERHAQRVREHDRPRPRRDGRPEPVRIGVVAVQADVDEHRDQAVLDDRRDGARESPPRP